MFDRRFLAEAGVLIAASVLCAMVANTIAARERQLAWVGDYPNARVVPQPITGERAVQLTPVILEREPDLSPDQAPVTDTAATAPVSTATAAPVPGAMPAPATAARPAPAPAQSQPKYTLADFPPAPDKASLEITSDQAVALWQLNAPFLDARRSDVYRQGHIARSRPFPVWESDIDARVAAFYEEGHDQEKPVVVYCSGGACEDSHMLAQKLWGLGFNNVLVYTDGWPDWIRRGMPVGRGEQP
jgi:rhodanese-related sulfurtransferase